MNNSEDHGSIQPDIAKITATDLADTLSAMTQAVQELGQVVKTLSSTVVQLSTEKTDASDMTAKLSDEKADPLADGDKKVADEEEVWEIVRDTVKDQDKETIDSWKDELNNLLVFAGLFSAVVTAFTVESYTWLQQDPGDASNMLLANLSLQLSAFTIAFFSTNSVGSGLINSTTPALSLSNVTSSFIPVSYAVPVNLLWVLSLTLSLVSAFFAIAAQQWLRQLRIPPDMPVRRAVQLLAFRQDGLKVWQVPSIISLLPLLLQIAVVLFLVGLFLLLQSLNATITVTFCVVALVALLAFLATTVAPLFTIHCPYKSPVVPTAIVISQCMTYPLALLSIPVLLSFKIMLKSIIRVYERTVSDNWTVIDAAHRVIRHLVYDVLLPYIKSLGRHMFVDLSQFWLSREYEHIFSRDEKEQTNLERTSLIQTFLSMSSHRLPKPWQSLSRIGTERCIEITQGAIVQSLSAFHPGLEWSNIVPYFALDTKIAPYIRKWLSTRHHRLLLRLLQERDWTQDTEASRVDSNALTVCRELDQAVAGMPQPFAKHLTRICANQQVSKNCWTCETVPVCLLLDVVSERNYALDEDDATAIYSFSLKFLLEEDGLLGRDWYRLLSAATALTLIASRTASTASTTGMPKIINMFAKHLDEGQTRRYSMDDLQKYYSNTDGWSKEYPPFLSPVKIHQALCKALANYASADTLPLDASHLQYLARILEALHDVYREGFRYIDRWTYVRRAESDEARERRETDKRSVEDELKRLDDILSSKNARLHPVELPGGNPAEALASEPAAGLSGTSNHANIPIVDNDIPARSNNAASANVARFAGTSGDEPKVETLEIAEAGTAEEIQPATETTMTPSSSELQSPAGDVLSVCAADPEGERTDARRAAITSAASSTSPTTDNLENIALPWITAFVVPTEDSEPEIPLRDSSAPDTDQHAKGNSNNDTIQDPTDMSTNANESTDISSKTEETENTNEPLQVGAAVMPDGIHDQEVLSGGAATDSDDPGYIEDSRMAPHLPDTTSPSTRPYDDGASPEATAASAPNDSVV